jgi:hypothetical protein
MNKNAILDEKDIFLDVPLDEAGDSEVVDLKGASKFSCQAIYVVNTPSGASVTFQKSNDSVNWNDIQAATSITVDGSAFVEQANVDYRYFKAVKALASGTVDLKGLVLVIGDAI